VRIWDISPGYLNRQSLLGEHRELHALASILAQGKKGYSRHPETLRWVEHTWALACRHRLLACEMALRGYREQSPLPPLALSSEDWPKVFLDQPAEQLALLGTKYRGREQGRIPLPRSIQQLWSQHKYSVLARSPQLYTAIGRTVAHGQVDCATLALQLTQILRQAPSPGRLRNAIQHLWGHVADLQAKVDCATWTVEQLLQEIQTRVIQHGEPYLLASTALGECMAWCSEAAPLIKR
jgi:hypothetical protein